MRTLLSIFFLARLSLILLYMVYMYFPGFNIHCLLPLHYNVFSFFQFPLGLHYIHPFFLWLSPQKNKNILLKAATARLHSRRKHLTFELFFLLCTWSGQHETEVLLFKTIYSVFLSPAHRRCHSVLLTCLYRVHVIFQTQSAQLSLRAGVSDQVHLQHHD